MLSFILTMAVALLQPFIKNPQKIAKEFTILGEARRIIDLIIGPETAPTAAARAGQPFQLSKETEQRIADLKRGFGA